MIRSAQVRFARRRYKEMAPVLNEQSRRRFVAMEAQALGRGGVSLMAQISGLARRTIYHGLSDIRDRRSAEPGRVRRRGGGRKNKAARYNPRGGSGEYRRACDAGGSDAVPFVDVS